MRSRSNSGIRLDYYYKIVHQTILKYQNPVTGLIALSEGNSHAWVRDNVYSIISVWALALAYRKNADADEERAKAYELEQTVVKLMRGLLTSMMGQVDKVERFKHTQSPRDALHAKYSSVTQGTVVADSGWGHLQIDATSLFLLMLAQMTASGLHIIFTLDEQAFVQNLVFYVESAYRIPDYGVWERGDKTNHGLPELNASSIGMAKAALEAMSELDLFGARGGAMSTVHVMADKIAQCNAILQSMLPRESNSKEVDSSLLSIIGYPAFAVDDVATIELTHKTVVEKLEGKYGCCRFLRDGFRTALEDPHRLYYEPWELQQFENVECEWPVFFAFLAINEFFRGNKEKAKEYLNRLQQLLVSKDNIKVVPEMYAVPMDHVSAERASPGSQERQPIGQIPHKWGQSLYIVGRLLADGFLSPGELDPINRRQVMLPRPDLVVQIVILAEDDEIKAKLGAAGYQAETLQEVQAHVYLHPAKRLLDVYSRLGEHKKLGLTGRCAGIGLLSTSKLYRFQEQIYAFMPELYDQSTFYLAVDQDFLLDQFRTDLEYLKANWQMLGRPIFFMPMYRWMSDFSKEVYPEFVRVINKMKSGYLYGVRVQLGDVASFLSTSCVTPLTWLSVPNFESRGVASSCGTDPPLSDVIEMLNKPLHSKPQRQRLPSGGASDLSGHRSELYAGPFGNEYNGKRIRGNIRDRRHLPHHLDLEAGPGVGTAAPGGVFGIVRRTLSIHAEEERWMERPAFQIGDADDDVPETSPVPPRRSSKQQAKLGSKRSPNASFRESIPAVLLPSPTTPAELPHRIPGVTYRHHHGTSRPSAAMRIPRPENAGGLDAMPVLPPSPSGHLKVTYGSSLPSSRLGSMAEMEHMDKQEGRDLVELLRNTDQAVEQADIIHYLYITKGPEWDTKIGGISGCTVKDLLIELYEKACAMKRWWLVRYTAGMLHKRMASLGSALSDLLVRQKQVLVGRPPLQEVAITQPLSPDDLAAEIDRVCGEDVSSAVLTQEVLVYLAMYIRTEPKLFHEMLRLRIGLIIQVMASELGRCLMCSGEEASLQLLDLSPYELKSLLHHILSGKEFGLATVSCAHSGVQQQRLTVVSKEEDDARMSLAHQAMDKRMSASLLLKTSPGSPTARNLPSRGGAGGNEDDDSTSPTSPGDKSGSSDQWLRRRRIDGSLNRVPIGFYPKIWHVLNKCQGIIIEGKVLSQNLVKEMTAGELKFALQFESALTTVPEPEYRQLLVEALMTLALFAEMDSKNHYLNMVIPVNNIVGKAAELFLDDQRDYSGMAAQCCATRKPSKLCQRIRNICEHFYDDPPSGQYGTLTYMCRAVSEVLPLPTANNSSSPAEAAVECAIC